MDKITNLYQTAKLMSSENFQERFVAEYAQVKIRYLRLERVLQRIKDKSAPDCFEPTCPIGILEEQLVIMRLYIKLLVMRSNLEGIILPEVEI